MFDYKYIAIDLKSFYASVECADRGLNPLTTNLVVADARRSEKTICLAVSPSLKAYGVGGRARLFEAVRQVREVNAERLQALRCARAGAHSDARTSGRAEVQKAKSANARTRACVEACAATPDGRSNTASRACKGDFGSEGSDNQSFRNPHLFEDDCTGRDLEKYRPFEQSLFTSASFDDAVVQQNPEVELDFLIARPRMAKYIEVSTKIYQVYLKYFSPDDIHVYSIDEVFIDASKYANVHKMDIKTLASTVVSDVFQTTGITATAGIGTNLFLSKVALDVLAKHEEPDENGVRIAMLGEQTYKERIWPHRPLTDIWRVGRGYARKLEANGMFTMGDVARCSLGNRGDKLNEDLLFKLFGKNAELLIDHAWGHEPVTMREIKEYKPAVNCKASGQVLQHAYSTKAARLVVREMADALAFDLLAEGLVTDKLTLTVGYDCSCLEDGALATAYAGPVTSDRYGREVPQHAHGTVNLEEYTASSRIITKAILELYDRLVNPKLLVRRINLSAERVVSKEIAEQEKSHGQMSLFDWEEEAGAPSAGTGAAAADADVATAGVVPAGAAGAHRTAAGGMPGAPFGAECGEGAAGVSPSSPSSSEAALLEKERFLHDAVLDVRNKFGKNAVLRAVSLQEGATARQRNNQIGGHNA